MASVNNLYIDQGTNFSATIQVFDDDGDPFNLTGFTPSGQIRRNYATNTIAANLVTSVPNAANGQINIALTYDKTNALKAGRYVYDVEIYNSTSNVIYRAAEGIVVVYPGVTR